MKPGIPLFRREFGYFGLERWKKEGMPADVPLETLFQYDPPGNHGLGNLGWCEAAFLPAFEDTVIEDRGEYEVVQDYAGRHVLFFKGRRSGFMPTYLKHPVRDMKTWEEDVRWRLDTTTSERYSTLPERMAEARAAAGEGLMIVQGIIGAYMYLRALMGPEDLLVAFVDQPELIHACMRAWFELADAVTAGHQEHVTVDELFFGEDICYNHGSLISPDMMHEFLLPYYQQLVTNMKRRQIDRSRHMYLQIDTDGYAPPVIPLYEEIGMDVMSPFEVAAGCDLLKIAKENPTLVMFGGIDKRVMAQGKQAIDEFLERIIPPMRERGGYIPTCDHGVPEEVSYQDYLHYRKRCVELGG
jgi:uroporphyrinogen decarboxylase